MVVAVSAKTIGSGRAANYSSVSTLVSCSPLELVPVLGCAYSDGRVTNSPDCHTEQPSALCA